MEQYQIVAPSLGEGLRTLKVTSCIKKAGDLIGRDEPILLVETDKATMEIESPVNGILSKWLYKEGENVPVGDILGLIDLGTFPEKRKTRHSEIKEIQLLEKNGSTLNYNKHTISENQQKLVQAMRVSALQVIPATIHINIPEQKIREYRSNQRKAKNLVPSTTELFGWAIAQAANKHGVFRSQLKDDNNYNCYHELNLGIAVSLPKDELITVAVRSANSLNLENFIHTYRDAISKKDTNIPVHVILSDLSSFGVSQATPTLVYPSIAVIVLCKSEQAFILSMTFDHRLINGVTAAKFLHEVQKTIKNL